jgi:3-oxosteroid 1-dehydrogenase
MIFDAGYRHKYSVGGRIMPASMRPDSWLPKRYWNQLLFKGVTLSALAYQIGVDAQNLQETVIRFNRFADTGKDEDFGRGDSTHDRYYSDPANMPNANLGKLLTPVLCDPDYPFGSRYQGWP